MRAATTGSSTLPNSTSRCGTATGELPDDTEPAVGDGGPASCVTDAAESAVGLRTATHSMPGLLYGPQPLYNRTKYPGH